MEHIKKIPLYLHLEADAEQCVEAFVIYLPTIFLWSIPPVSSLPSADVITFLG